MPLFKKSEQLVEILNKINNVENKIDILNNKLESITFIDGCCDCKKRESKIYNDLQEFLDDKLVHIKNSLIEIINTNLNCDCSTGTDTRLYKIEDSVEKIKNVIEEQRGELSSALKKCCETQNNKTDLSNLLVQNKTDVVNNIVEYFKNSDMSLRNDLQTFLLNFQKEFNSNLSSQTTSLDTQQQDLNKRIEELSNFLNSMNFSINGLFYENELIKHQLSLEDDIRKYHDEIENLKLLANNIKNSIDSMLTSCDSK